MEYEKAFKSIYEKLVETGDEESAFKMAEKRYKDQVSNGKVEPSEMLSTTLIHRLVCEIRNASKVTDNT